jgi:hypothetical protein
MNIQEAAVAFHAAARAAFTMSQHGYKARARRPQIGDMVIEISSFGEVDSSAIGVLLMANRSKGMWRILTFDGHGITWHNAEFIAAPINGAQRLDFMRGPA